MYVHIYIYIIIHTYTHIHTYIHTYTLSYAQKYLHTFVSNCSLSTYCTYIHTYTQYIIILTFLFGVCSNESDGHLPWHSHHRRGRPISELRQPIRLHRTKRLRQVNVHEGHRRTVLPYSRWHRHLSPQRRGEFRTDKNMYVCIYEPY